MAESDSVRIITPMPRSLVQEIDDYRFATHSPTRAAAMRELMRNALTAFGPVPSRRTAVATRRRARHAEAPPVPGE